MTKDRFVRHADPILGEEVLVARAASGMPVRVVPTARFRDVCAVVSVGYGSTDLGFAVDGGSVHRSPEGVAHFLEHKLFEDQDLHVFERFGKRGARVNAMTGFGRTTYYFQAGTAFEANLEDLLRLVSRAHLTPENVDKERGIIAQELRMYEDSPVYRGFFGLLGALYAEHPVRHPVGGTVESIADIDVEELLACFGAFYRSGNMALAVAGPVEPDRVLELADAAAIPAGAAPERFCPDDLGIPMERRVSVSMEVARPRFLLGYKDRQLVADPEVRLRRDLATRVCMDLILGAGSDAREEAQRSGAFDDSMTGSYLGEARFGTAALVCETEDAPRVEAVLRELLERPLDVREADLERIRRRQLGSLVRSFDSVQSLAFGQAEEALLGIAPFGQLARMQALSIDDVEARRAELFDAESSATCQVG
jgi:predicted Zn-dependent peptidase